MKSSTLRAYGAIRLQLVGYVIALAGCVQESPLSGVQSSDAPFAVVQLDSGPVSGTAMTSRAGKSLNVFKGIPYASPPIGDLRWRAPQSVAPWKDVLPATTYSNACMQGPAPLPVVKVGSQSEDCLYLNVWTPASTVDAGLPVMVFIHGGSFTTGAGSLYSGEYLASKGAVVLSFNYRLDVFGFLTHADLAKESSVSTYGNYGLLDQVAVLQWVQRNIHAFGGDPQRITIFGQSAGGESVADLMAMPQAQGLFHSAIIESGGPTDGSILPDDAKKNGDEFAKRLGCQTAQSPVECMRSVKADDVLAANQSSNGQTPIDFGPFVDDVYWTESPQATWDRGAQSSIPLIVGTTRDEEGLFLTTPVSTDDQYKDALRKTFGDYEPQVYAAFTPQGALDIRQALVRALTSAFYTTPAREMLRSAYATGAPAYQYQFARLSNYMSAFGGGVIHGSEIFYLFGWLYDKDGFSDVDYQLADALQTAWVRFAATTNPSDTWPRFESGSTSTQAYIEFGDSIGAKTDLCATQNSYCDLFDRWIHSK